jgi:protein TonB
MVVADPEVLACSGETSPGPKATPAGDDLPRRVGFSIQEPRKIHSVPPVYPTAEKAARVQGVVILEAVVSPTGCVSDLRVIRSVRPRLDLAALVAVAQWRYTPTLVNGQAVPVLMAITVNFRVN